MAETDGNSTYRNRIIDAIYNFYTPILEKALQVKAAIIAVAIGLFVASLFPSYL